MSIPKQPLLALITLISQAHFRPGHMHSSGTVFPSTTILSLCTTSCLKSLQQIRTILRNGNNNHTRTRCPVAISCLPVINNLTFDPELNLRRLPAPKSDNQKHMNLSVYYKFPLNRGRGETAYRQAFPSCISSRQHIQLITNLRPSSKQNRGKIHSLKNVVCCRYAVVQVSPALMIQYFIIFCYVTEVLIG